MIKNSPLFQKMANFCHLLQDEICSALVQEDGHSFKEDRWDRPGRGGGRSRIFTQGQIFEKGGVNVSSVQGELDIKMAHLLKVAPGHFSACGISLVLHPFSPKIPTVHMNVRMFEMENGPAWFGGGD